ncbi:hypothetical protein E3P92_00900 [Wallemia ichthyophaga]|uniref:Uncharacterized protein n=1 Tax=Wallemia ichthyophaga TaxID=245174 RepID=A0A4T0IDF8_WALIC|nr:hypothetical protein E3P96_02812 [Wallemia ichthyophaga]TIB02621.1 hypothetical protein E3P95_00853 [Wallemia ichthyophaga]TIB03553.1 hypothetical protein E3P94_00985 [Wallemia ichthyophaga]TIB15758.1 hypothetical protein E3P90_00773 [Wallemia ichthyophaga]TIB17636.1 hypothetical protein E3P93_00630 [Wallemia ichthyophaga]
MFASTIRAGARRTQLTTKGGNKDYYKGTRTGYIDGYRTGPAGRHAGKSNNTFILDDSKARVFVAPANFHSGEAPLKPYVERSAQIDKPWSTLVTENLFKQHNPSADAEDEARRCLEPATESLSQYKALKGGLNKKDASEVRLLQRAFGAKRVSKLLLENRVKGPSKHSRKTYASAMDKIKYRRILESVHSVQQVSN